MKSNDRILQEAFFKKTTYQDKLNKKLPQYTPVGSKDSKVSFAVNDFSELKRRLVSGLGVSFANNSIKAVSNKAIKQFPIIISDNIEPETVVMLKRYLEEQYAEYINLMISNKVIDIADFKTGDDNGNIAIQAIDSISGPDFSSDRIARKARDTGDVKFGDFVSNFPLYSILKQESAPIHCGNQILDTLLENAVIVPSEYTEDLVNILSESDEPPPPPRDPIRKRRKEFNPDDELYDTNEGRKTARQIEINQRLTTDDSENSGVKAGIENGTYTHGLTTGRAVVMGSKAQPQMTHLDRILDRTTADILYDPKNKVIKDKFQKASILVASRRISGNEYANYLKIRLGLPLSGTSAAHIRAVYPASEVDYVDGRKISSTEARYISNSLDTTSPEFFKEVRTIGSLKFGAIAGISAGVLGVGASHISRKLSGAATPFADGIIKAISNAPVWAPPVIAALGGTALGLTIAGLVKVIKKNRDQKLSKIQTEGWERVERLIDDMDKNHRELINKSKAQAKADAEQRKEESARFENLRKPKAGQPELEGSRKDASTEELEKMLKSMDAFLKKLDDNMRKPVPVTESVSTFTFDSALTESEMNEIYDMVLETLKTDEELRPLMEAELADMYLLSEKPVTIDDYLGKVKARQITYDPKQMSVTPAYSARSQYAYGSTEYDRREIKDRKYNAPLIMTIRFKERLDDGRYSDNEMTAVIGIQGVVIRVPSEEMKYILKSNAEGNTLKGFLGSSTIGNAIADLMSGTKLKSDVEKLPISADVWHNMEKISHLALANKLGGKQSHNISNAHIIFSQQEIDNLRNETGIDYMKDKKLAEQLLKRYSAFSIMIANDPSERVYVFDDPDNISWNVIPYSALRNRDSSDQLTSALIRASQGRL